VLQRSAVQVERDDAVPRSALVDEQIERIVDRVCFEDVVGIAGDLAPRCARPGDGGGRCDVGGYFVLHAVRDESDSPARARRYRYLADVLRRKRDARIESVPEDRRIAVGIAPEHVQARDALAVLLALRLVRPSRRRAEVVERAAVLTPRRRDVDRAFDHVAQQPSAAHVDDVHDGLLGAAFRDADGDVTAVVGRRIVVDRVMLALRAREAIGIEHEPLGTADDRPHVDARGVRAGRALLVEIRSPDGLDVADRFAHVVAGGDRFHARDDLVGVAGGFVVAVALGPDVDRCFGGVGQHEHPAVGRARRMPSSVSTLPLPPCAASSCSERITAPLRSHGHGTTRPAMCQDGSIATSSESLRCSAASSSMIFAVA
jgi:hypothetical protein